MLYPRAVALLPPGLEDLLPEAAAAEAAAEAAMLHALAQYGYDRVDPPLAEYEDSLLSGIGAGLAPATLRLQDPGGQRLLAVRADLTPAVARIAATRLVADPRPLRLAYAGPVLRATGLEVSGDRQLTQVGAELIGADLASADAEIVTLAAACLTAVGLTNVAVDLNLPTLVPALMAAHGLAPEQTALVREALDRHDADAAAAAAPALAATLRALVDAVGRADRALPRLAALNLPPAAAQERARLADVVSQLAGDAPGLAVTVDPIERRGFEYQTGLSFTLFAEGLKGEVGRGGRYRVAGGPPAGQPGEPATGFTINLRTLLPKLPQPKLPPRIYLAHGTDGATAHRLRTEGWATVAALAPEPDAEAAARSRGATALWRDGRLVRL